MSEVWPRLYVGGLSSLSLVPTLNIEHVISVELQCAVTESRVLHVAVTDEETSDLLSFWPTTNAFIEEALSNEGAKVLVHCVHGVSRSAATAAAFIIKMRGGAVSSVIDAMRLVRPSVCPNEGFMLQLELFNQMGCQLSPSCPSFKLYSIVQKNSVPETFDTHNPWVRCASCRWPLATKGTYLSHCRGEVITWQSMVKSNKCSSNARDKVCKLSVFVARFDANFQAENGRLHCSNCQCKLGHWAMSALAKCPCGAALYPGWVLTPSKVLARITA